ncbi:alpha/beta hydrolase [Kineosporia sp. J2-2]|uniref:Alpha/beta hydrolase n=1 Tax=Kineosporia corallincola TaxID=2835133 RepID=A0ABS5TRC6_9ACTN|nr:alpha/beta hydrolase [Kineosporia corallincola]MBT0773353.1 alpha/beta hydrolase [Kineosporia corallincola]
MPYVELPGSRTYHEITGAGEPLLLLHGGFCSLEATGDLNRLLSARYRVHGPERPGHGRTPDQPQPYAYAAMVDHTLAYLDAIGVPRAHVVGFSDGAITGLLLARDHPRRVASLVAISANLDPSGFVPDEQAALSVSARQHEQLGEEYGRLSPDGAGHADTVVGKLLDLWKREPQITPDSLASVTAPTLVMAGDRDMVTLEHTASIAAAVPGAQLCVVPGAGHLLVRECPELVGAVVTRFLASVPALAGR